MTTTPTALPAPDITGDAEPPRLTAALLTPAGNLHRIALPHRPAALLQAVYRVLGCDGIEAVTLASDLHLYVDDEGLINGQGINYGISYLVRRHQFRVSQPYAGPAVLLGGIDHHGDDRPLTPQTLRNLETVIRDGNGRVVRPGPDGVCARAQAIVDGDLILVPPRLAATHGFDLSLAITRSLWQDCITRPDHTDDNPHRDHVPAPTRAVGRVEHQRLADLLSTAHLVTRTGFPRGVPFTNGVRPLTTIPFTQLCAPSPADRPDGTELDLAPEPVPAAYTTGSGIDPAPSGTLHRPDETPPII